MAKLLLVVAVFTVVYLILRNYGKKKNPPTASGQGGSGKHASESKHGEDMVRCQVCGVHLPKSEAVTSRGEMYCSREHMQVTAQDRSGR